MTAQNVEVDVLFCFCLQFELLAGDTKLYVIYVGIAGMTLL